MDGILYRLDWLYSSMARYFGGKDDVNDPAIALVGNAHDIFGQALQNVSLSDSAGLASTGRSGRPKFSVPLNQLQFLL